MIIAANMENIEELVGMGLKLWPDNDFDELKEEFIDSINADDEGMFLYEDEQKNLVGFMQLSVRTHYVEGCDELGSDCELENTLSIEFHNGVGFEEANRLVCFIKKIY